MWRDEVERRIASRPHLIPVWTNVFGIPERLREYDPSLFVCYNAIRHLQKAKGEKPEPPPPGIIPKWGGWFEVHSLDRPGINTLLWLVSFGELDCRILRHIWQNDIRVHGRRAVDAIFERNKKNEERYERDWRNKNEAIARELYRPFANAAWDGRTIFGPGTLAG